MKNKKKFQKNTCNTENEAVYVAASINTCIACGREIPEGMLVCVECEVGASTKRCTICNRLIAESDSICENCKAHIFRSKNKD